MKQLLGWLTFLGGFVLGFAVGFYAAGIALTVTDGRLLLAAALLVALVAGTFVALARVMRLETHGNSAIALPISSSLVGLAIGAMLYGSLFVLVTKWFGGTWL